MTDPTPAMESFQEELAAGRLFPGQSFTDPALLTHVDQINGKMRVTFVTLDDDTVTAFLTAIRVQPIDDLPCFTIGYAVPEDYQGEGRATAILNAVIKEFSAGFKSQGNDGFAVEAVVSVDNLASQKVASRVLSATPEQITDSVSGLPALYYVRKVPL